MFVSGIRAMVEEKRILKILLQIVIIWCISVQESVQLDYENTFERVLPDINLNHSVSRPIRLQLFSRASMRQIRIIERSIDAEGDNGDIYARLVIRTDSLNGQITIQGEETGYFLCMNKRGQVVGRKKMKRGSSVSCVFTETISHDDYTELKLFQKTDMYLGFNKDGRAVSAQRTRPGVKAVQFLKRPPEDASTDESSLSTADFYKYYQMMQQMGLNDRRDARTDRHS